MTDTRSLQQIKRETEQTRAGLTDTVEQLRTSVADTASDIRQRISPEHIKAEVSDYIRSRGEQLLDDVTAAARRNPMQAVAIGASIAYPLLRMARAIPLPVLMVGAGLFFAGSKTGQAASQKAMDMASDLSDEVQRRAHDVRDQVSESAAAAKSFASENIDRLRGTASGGTERVAQAANQAANQVNETANRVGTTLASGTDSLKDKAASFGASAADQAGDLKDRTMRAVGSATTTLQDAVGSAASSLQDIASDATSTARRVAGDAADAGLNAMKTARDTASDFSGRAGKTVLETIEQNPLVVAGVGLLIGGLIASALPRSDIEDGLIGGASNAVKKRAQAAASQGIDTAKDVAGEFYDKAVRQAEAEGLTPDTLGNAAQDIGQRVRRVAESAVTTAFEPQDNPKQNTNGVRDHG
jgi:hypothetical protein